MCGIAGYIGVSKKPKISYELISKLFDYLEVRGTDAAGVWATETGADGCVVYHKEPGKSSQFIKGELWQKLRKMKTDLMLVHARATSGKNGHAILNENNHPFVSTDHRIGLIHNGTLTETPHLKSRFDIESNTDSEFLLRIYEHGLETEPPQFPAVPEEVARRLSGVKDVWSYIGNGAMAVAVGERHEGEERSLVLFRNADRPLWVADMRDTLGQVFFFSTPDIWYHAVSDSQVLKNVAWGRHKLVEMPPGQVWLMKIDKEHPQLVDDNFFKFGLGTTGSTKEMPVGKKAILPPKVQLNIVTGMKPYDLITDDTVLEEDEGEIIVGGKITSLESLNAYCDAERRRRKSEERAEKEDVYDPDQYNEGQMLYDQKDWDESYSSASHEEVCAKIMQIAENILTTASNSCMESSMSEDKYQEMMLALEQTRCDLEGTLRILQM